jgi:hypothetical protein
MMAWLSLIAFAAGAAGVPCEVVTSGPVAQARLAEALAGADAIESMTVAPAAADRPLMVTFSVARDGALTRITATAARDGTIASLELGPAGPAHAGHGRLTWLAAELADAPAIVRLVDAGRDGVLLSTSDGRRYLVSPRLGPRTGNEGVEARWGAAWTEEDGGVGAVSQRAPAKRPARRTGA